MDANGGNGRSFCFRFAVNDISLTKMKNSSQMVAFNKSLLTLQCC